MAKSERWARKRKVVRYGVGDLRMDQPYWIAAATEWAMSANLLHPLATICDCPSAKGWPDEAARLPEGLTEMVAPSLGRKRPEET